LKSITGDTRPSYTRDRISCRVWRVEGLNQALQLFNASVEHPHTPAVNSGWRRRSLRRQATFSRGRGRPVAVTTG
ncbi:hypothetical protein RRG08_000780, partial [Elysia crispata]